jgi:GntR family transcriptional regulator/MocR family aminotransferase
MRRRSLHSLGGSLALDRRAGSSLQDQIVAFFRSAIAEGRLPAGRRLCSSRQFAADYGISRTTAVEAYDRLVDEGYLVARRGAGIFVAEVTPEHFRLKAGPGGSPRPVPPGAAGEEPGLFAASDARKYELPLAPGMPALDKFPWTAWMKLTNGICRERPLNALGYGDPQGELPLREAVREYLATARGIVCRPEQIIVMSGTEQIVSFAASQVTGRDDAVWFENPGYPFLRHVLRGIGLAPVPVAVDEQGMSVADGLRQAPAARLVVVSPTAQYPLGVTMSLERRRELIEWSQRTQSWIFENEIDGDYRYTANPVASIYSLAGSRHVIYCGSLSKPLAPGLRVNYLVAPMSLVGTLAVRTTLVPKLTQLVLARFNSEGFLASHMNKMRRLYAKRRALLLDTLRTEAAGLLDVDSIPAAGLRITASLLVDLNDVQIAAQCVKAGVQVDPLSACYARDWRRSGLIMGFASTPEEKMQASVRILVGVLRRALEARNPAGGSHALD